MYFLIRVTKVRNLRKTASEAPYPFQRCKSVIRLRVTASWQTLYNDLNKNNLIIKNINFCFNTSSNLGREKNRKKKTYPKFMLYSWIYNNLSFHLNLILNTWYHFNDFHNISKSFTIDQNWKENQLECLLHFSMKQFDKMFGILQKAYWFHFFSISDFSRKVKAKSNQELKDK